MAVIRKDILSDTTVRNKFIQGVKLLKQENSGRTTTDFGIAGPTQSVSTYDVFTIWHHVTMMTMTPPNNPAGRNAAHRGPIFLPWHRVMMILLEQNLQRVLADATFGLPYWNFGKTGDLPAAQQKTNIIWSAANMGGQGNPVTTGPFAFSAAPNSWRVRIATNVAGNLVSVNRGLRRTFASPPITTLPKTQHALNALQLTPYDSPNWDTNSSGFRNRVEGWSSDAGSSPPWMHNRVHVWVGGDMGPSTSPNDPVFYMNHCNVDRLWEIWMRKHGRRYLPGMNVGASLAGQRIDDQIVSPLGGNATPRQVLNVSSIYTYDVL